MGDFFQILVISRNEYWNSDRIKIWVGNVRECTFLSLLSEFESANNYCLVSAKINFTDSNSKFRNFYISDFHLYHQYMVNKTKKSTNNCLTLGLLTCFKLVEIVEFKII